MLLPDGPLELSPEDPFTAEAVAACVRAGVYPSPVPFEWISNRFMSVSKLGTHKRRAIRGEK